MEQVEAYRSIVRDVIADYLDKRLDQDAPTELVCDPVRDHYEVIQVGFEGNTRIHHNVVHLDIRNGKVWVQNNNTDRHIAQELVDAGIPKSDIVLGFQPPYKRPYTGYAVG